MKQHGITRTVHTVCTGAGEGKSTSRREPFTSVRRHTQILTKGVGGRGEGGKVKVGVGGRGGEGYTVESTNQTSRTGVQPEMQQRGGIPPVAPNGLALCILTKAVSRLTWCC